MTKDEFVDKRTEILSEMLSNPDTFGIYPSTRCYARLDDLFDEITGNTEKSEAQELRNKWF